MLRMLRIANEKDGWLRTVGAEVAMWLQMPELILGLHFEAELGNYFEEVMDWHNRTGPINTRSGFRLEEMFYLYFDFKVPWWNSAVTDPATVMPKTMKYLEENFEGEDLIFRRSQIQQGLNKGRDELILMTEKYLLRAPLIFCILSHLLSILYEHILKDDLAPDILIEDPLSPKWGFFDYTKNPSSRPANEQVWYDVLSSQTEDVIHWWHQLHLDKNCLEEDLQRLSRMPGSTATDSSSNSSDEGATYLQFTVNYPILFECLHATFGLMMSNSRLCEQIHGMMRAQLRSDIGMDQADAQLTHVTGLSYDMKGRAQASLS
jgi:hypothetical protein